MTRLNGFDALAPVYDILARMVFGRSLYRAQHAHVNSIKAGSTVLILGGGSGGILPAIFQQQPHKVVYIEASQRMLHRAQQQAAGKQQNTQVHWLHGTEHDAPRCGPYDYIITQFVLDVLAPGQLPATIALLKNSLNEHGLWLVADFRTGHHTKSWQRLLVWCMYRFFRLFARVEPKHLLPYHQYLTKAGMLLLHEECFFYDMIFAAVLVKERTVG